MSQGTAYGFSLLPSNVDETMGNNLHPSLLFA
jgi:hypothetical protein